MSSKEAQLAEYENIKFEPQGRVAHITLNREERRNAINPETSNELLQAFTEFKEND